MKRRSFLGFFIAAPLAPLATKLLPAAVVEIPSLPLAHVVTSALAATNFAELSPAAKTVWSRSIWEAARNQSFITKFDRPEIT